MFFLANQTGCGGIFWCFKPLEIVFSRPFRRSQNTVSGLDVAHLERHRSDDERGRAYGEEDDFGLADLRPWSRILKDQQPAFEMMRDKKILVTFKEGNVLHHEADDDECQCEN